MKRIIFILTSFLIASSCFGQTYDESEKVRKEIQEELLKLAELDRNRHLAPAEMFQYSRSASMYNKLLYFGFSPKPYARYTVMPAFGWKKYAFSAEKIKRKYYIISNELSRTSANSRESIHGDTNKMEIIEYFDVKTKETAGFQIVNVNTNSTKIKRKLYLKIGELFELLAEQTKELQSFSRTTADGWILTVGPIATFDGISFYFTSTDKNGEIKTGRAHNPDTDLWMWRAAWICNQLHSIGKGNNISQTDILNEINELTNELREF